MLKGQVLLVLPQKQSSLHLNGALNVVVQKLKFQLEGILVCTNKNFC